MEFRTIHSHPPKNTHFAAYHADGSGSDLFCWTDHNQIVDAEGDYICNAEDLQGHLCDADYCLWHELPKDFYFFFMK